MKRILVAAAAVAAAIAVAPPAQADEDFYLAELRENTRAATTDADAIKLGKVACHAMRYGLDNGLSMGKARAVADDAVAQAYYSLGYEVFDINDVYRLTEAAEHQLC